MIYHRPYLDVTCGQWVTTNMGNIEMWEILFRIVGHSSSLGCTLRFSVWFESEQSEDSGKIQYVTIKTCLELPWSEKCFIVIVEQKKNDDVLHNFVFEVSYSFQRVCENRLSCFAFHVCVFQVLFPFQLNKQQFPRSWHVKNKRRDSLSRNGANTKACRMWTMMQ